MENKENKSKSNRTKSTLANNSIDLKTKKNTKSKNEIADSKIGDTSIKHSNKEVKSNLKSSQAKKTTKEEENREDITLASQEEKIKKNAGKDSRRKKAAAATAVVLLLIAGVTVPTAVYLSRRKVSVDISNNVDVIHEYTINIKRGTTIKDIVPQEIKGYTFVGFYKDAALTNPYKDTDKINKDATIYAKYEANTYKVMFPTSPSFTIEGEGIVDNQVEVEYNSEYSFKLNLNAGYDESDIIVKVNGEELTPNQEGYYTITINGDMLIEVEGVEINTYEVTFYDSLEKNKIYQNQEIQYNQLCTYTGVTPTKTNTHTYKYTFIGWLNAQGEVVDLTTTRIVSDLELFANFKEEYIEYSIHKPEQVNVQNAEGIYLSNTATLHYGDIVTITYETTLGYDVTAFEVKGAEKVVDSENQYRITGNLEVIYTEEIQAFTVSIAVNNADYGTVSESSITVDYGTEITVSGNTITISDTTITATPATATAQYTYAFASWNTGNTTVTGDLIITATFTQTVNTYTVTWLNWDGSTLETDIEVKYGTTPTYDSATPTRTDAIYAYTFTGWSPAVSTVTGDVTYTAQFDQVAELLPYEINDFGEITKYTGTATEVVIPSTYTLLEDGTVIAGTDYTITAIDTEVFYRKNITSVTLPNTLESIRSRAFYECTGLTSITIPENLTYIGMYAFYGCSNLATVTFAEYSQAKRIDSSAFKNCTSLTKITIPASVTRIEYQAFYGCSNLATVTFDENSQLEHLGQSAFSNCDALTSIVIPTPVTRIEEWVFSGCSNLATVTFEENSQLTHIGVSAFLNCTSLTSITIPASVTRIESFVFSGCTGLTEVTFENIYGWSLYETKGGSSTELIPIDIELSSTDLQDTSTAATYLTDTYKSYFWLREDVEVLDFEINDRGEITKYTGTDTEVIIPSTYSLLEDGTVIAGTDYTITGIADGSASNGAFYNNKNITSVTLPNTLEMIGNFAFSGCTGLTSITIPESVTSIGERSFYGCTGLTSITIPGSVTSIGRYAFNGCTGLTSITIPDSVTSIGGFAFSGCDNLANVYYEGTIEEWIDISFASNANPLTNGANLFVNGDELVTEINIDSATTIKAYVFQGCKSLTKVTIGSQVTSIGEWAFYGCTGLTSITIPESVTSIESYAFSGCTGLTSITIPESVTSIGDSAFSECTGLTSITIPESVTSIGEWAFSGCTGLTSITIPESVTSIGEYAFNRCRGLTSITIPESITSIGSSAFAGCTGLTSITIPDSVTSIGEDAFERCRGLTSITIPGSVTSIGSRAFRECTGLTSITIPESVTSIESYTFSGCTGLVSITIPESVTSIGERAFSGCTGLTSITIPDSVTSIGSYAFLGCNLTSVTIESNYAYKNAGTGENQCGYLLQDATVVRVLTSCIGEDTNSYLENTSNFTKSIDGEYTVYTKVS